MARQPTDEQRLAAIEHLRDIKMKVPQFSAFGDDNRARIERAIEVLVDEDEPESLDDDGDYDLYRAGMDAWDWLQGDFDIEDGIDFPNSWDGLAGMAQPAMLRREDFGL